MNTEATPLLTTSELGERAREAVADVAGAMARATELQRRMGEGVQEAMVKIGRLRPYAAPASDRPSGAARRRSEHERLKNGITPVTEKAGIPRGRQGVKRSAR